MEYKMYRNELLIATRILRERRLKEANRAQRRRARALGIQPETLRALGPSTNASPEAVAGNTGTCASKPRRPETETPWNPPRRHGGARDVARNSKKTARGFTVFNGVEVEHESGIEEGVSLITQADRRVGQLFSQHKKVLYYDNEGKRRSYTFDYYVVMKDGTKIAVSVKPERHRVREEKLVERIAMTGQYSGIDKFVVYTNAQATRPKIGNARHILWSRQHHDLQEVEKVIDLIGVRTSIQYWEMFDHGRKNWKREAAIWHLIDVGRLQAVDPSERVTELTRLLVRP
jgi:hypothetical protein